VQKKIFHSQNLTYRVMDAHILKFNNESFDTVVSIEVFEHLKDQSKVLEEVRRVLKTNGIFVLSTPNKICSKGKNPYHVKEFFKSELEIILKKYFSKVKLYGQTKSEKVKKIHEGNRFKNILAKIDFLRFRDIFLKGKIRKIVYHLFGFNIEEDIDITDFVVSEKYVEKSDTLIGVCKK